MKLITSLGNTLQNLYLTTQPKPWKPQKPVIIQFPINDICNARCQMCNIWQQKFDYQISPQELAIAISNPLFSEVRGVGINGGEPTLRKDLAEIVDVLFTNLPKLSGISLITNSLNSNQVIERITEIGRVIKTHRGNLDVMVSLDGVGEVHDRVRGRKGNFENAVKVIDFIQTSDLVSSQRLGCTVIKENVYGVYDLLEFALSKDIYIKYRLGLPHQRLYSQDVSEPFDLTFGEKYHLSIFLENIIRFYETSEQQKFFYKSLIGQIMYGKPRTAGCDWQHRGVTLSARGELLYCAVESKTLGSSISENSEHLYFANQEHLANIVKTKCDTCVHDYVGLPPTSTLLNNYLNKGLVKLGINPQELKKSPLIKPVKEIKKKISFQKRMIGYGVDLAKINNSQPTQGFSRHNSEQYRVLICGWYGTETLGDKGILGGVVNSLQSALGNLELHLASLELYISEMTIQQMPELEGCYLHSITDAIEIAGTMDLVVFGGGPLMAIPNLAEMIAIFQRSVEAKVPTLIAGCGVGPLGNFDYNQAIKSLLHLSSYRIYRDEKSRTLAESLGICTSEDLVAEDPALTWVKSSLSSLKPIENPQKSPVLFLGLRDWPYQEYAPHLTVLEAEKIKNNFEFEIIVALNQLIDQYADLSIIPFPMCTNHLGNDDRWFYRRLLRNNQEIKDRLDLSYSGAEQTPLSCLKAFQSASMALTMRFHSLVFALATGVPSVAVDYTLGKGKVKSLAEKYQVPYRSLDLINAEFIVSQFNDAINSDKSIPSSNFDESSLKFMDSINLCVKRMKQ
jgi:polysaccharide pyruvyl transferase WcaK-like protein/MoaA/NifB/PqqE/SkfB family radical SAM enzyme